MSVLLLSVNQLRHKLTEIVHESTESGRLEFSEFVQLAAKFIVEEDAEAMQKELKEAFRLYDKEGNGFIPTTCLKEILRELDDQLTDHDLDGMIEEIDSDGSGTVDFDGKCQFCRPSIGCLSDSRNVRKCG